MSNCNKIYFLDAALNKFLVIQNLASKWKIFCKIDGAITENKLLMDLIWKSYYQLEAQSFFSPVTWMIRSHEERATEVNGGTKSDNGWELEWPWWQQVSALTTGRATVGVATVMVAAKGENRIYCSTPCLLVQITLVNGVWKLKLPQELRKIR